MNIKNLIKTSVFILSLIVVFVLGSRVQVLQDEFNRQKEIESRTLSNGTVLPTPTSAPRFSTVIGNRANTKPLFPDIDDLYGMVSEHMEDIALTGVWEHTLSNGETLQDRMKVRGMTGIAGETLYRGSCSLKEVTKQWDESPTHAAIMNNEKYDQVVVVMAPITVNGVEQCYATANYKLNESYKPGEK